MEHYEDPPELTNKTYFVIRFAVIRTNSYKNDNKICNISKY